MTQKSVFIGVSGGDLRPGGVRGGSIRVADRMIGDPLKEYPKGRRCERCGSKLSIYNAKKMCSPCTRSTRLEMGPPLSRKEVDKLSPKKRPRSARS